MLPPSSSVAEPHPENLICARDVKHVYLQFAKKDMKELQMW
jgi:hypothetical protein